MKSRSVVFGITVLLLQILFLLIFAFLAEYDPSAHPDPNHFPNETVEVNMVARFYPMFQDVHVMMFVGFGFLMTFLKLYGYSAVGVNFLVAAFVLQVALIVRGFIHYDIIGGQRFRINVSEMLSADFASATVLITFGAVLGKTSPLQLLLVAVIETILAQINEYIGLHHFHVNDVGESMFVHVFGAYFGLAVARVLYSEENRDNDKNGAVYHSDIFSMIGTVFLWLFWPSFNGGAAIEDEQHRAVINTYMSLSACAIITFALSGMIHRKGQFDMVHIQNATLAGGVAVGTAANMPIEPWGAVLIGSVAATISVLGFKYLSPLMEKHLRIHDTCGVHNLHGMPGLLAGIAGAVMAALASEDTWKISMCQIFPAMGSGVDGATPCSEEVQLTRTAIVQGGYQMAALSTTLAIAIGGGVLTGFLLKIPFIWGEPKGDDIFDDKFLWHVGDYALPLTKVRVNGDTEMNLNTQM